MRTNIMKTQNTATGHTEIRVNASISHRELESMQESRTRLCLVRHGELTTSKDWIYVGHLDVEMNDTGIEQIKRLAARLLGEEVDVIISSDLKRTAKSAEILGRMLGPSPMLDPDFREINLGLWEGLTRDEIVHKYKEDFNKRTSDISGFRVEKGESFVDLKNRVIPTLMSYLKEYNGKCILLVAHGGVNRVILCHVLGLDLNNLARIDQAYGCLNIIDYFDDMPVVRLVNEMR